MQQELVKKTTIHKPRDWYVLIKTKLKLLLGSSFEEYGNSVGVSIIYYFSLIGIKLMEESARSTYE